MRHYFREISWWIDRLDMQEWMLILFSMIILGFLCLRGFGSRSKY